MSTIYHVYKDGKLTKGQVPPIWAIFFGAVALVVGLATYGYHTMRAMGVKLAKLTPTRGFAAELATALTVTVASQYVALTFTYIDVSERILSKHRN